MVTPEPSSSPDASRRPASSTLRWLPPPGRLVREASCRRSSEAYEGNLAHLLGEPRGVVAQLLVGFSPRDQVRLAQPDPQSFDLLPIQHHRRRAADFVALEQLLRKPARVDEHVGYD